MNTRDLSGFSLENWKKSPRNSASCVSMLYVTGNQDVWPKTEVIVFNRRSLTTMHLYIRSNLISLFRNVKVQVEREVVE